MDEVEKDVVAGAMPAWAPTNGESRIAHLAAGPHHLLGAVMQKGDVVQVSMSVSARTTAWWSALVCRKPIILDRSVILKPQPSS